MALQMAVESLPNTEWDSADFGQCWRLGTRAIGGISWAAECFTCSRMRFDLGSRSNAVVWLHHHAVAHGLVACS
jgi:hypothetical protein